MNDEAQPEMIPPVFFQSDNGNEPVRDWLMELDGEDRRAIGRDLMDIQYGWPVGMPLCRSLGDGLWECRSGISSGRISRVIFCFHDSELVALHGFVKKSQKTPKQDRDIALKRVREHLK